MKYLAFLVLFLGVDLSAQFQLSDWQLFTSFNSPSGATQDTKGNLWVSTTGGVYRYNPSDSTYITFNKLNGLSDLQYTSIISMPENNWIICGSNQGAIDIIDDESLEILNINDLKNFSSVGAPISKMIPYNGIIYVASTIGLSEFKPQKGVESINQTFGDTYQTLGLIDIAVLNNEIYILVQNQGIFKIQIGKIITDPSNWIKVNLNNATGSDLIGMLEFDNKLYIQSANTIWEYAEDSVKVIDEFDTYEYLSLANFNQSLYAVTFFSAKDIFTGEIFFDFSVRFKDAFDFKSEDENNLLLLTEENGVKNYSNDATQLVPNSLALNTINDIAIYNDEIWLTTGLKGTMYFDGSNWDYFSNNLKDIWDTDISGIAHKSLYINPEGTVYVGQKGSGLYEFSRNQDSFDLQIYSDSNSVFKGITDFVPGTTGIFNEVGESISDQNGILWSVNNGVNTKGFTLVAKNDDQFKGFGYIPEGTCIGQDSRGYYHIEIDTDGTKWLGSDESSEVDGLFLFNENGTLEDESDDICKVIRISNLNDLPNNQITDIALDKNGWMWVGTPTGLVYFINPGAFLYSDNPNDMIPVTASIFDGLNVVDIKIDAVNNKWVATSEDIQIFDSEGTELLYTINSTNSPLPNSGITTLEMIEETGEVLIGSATGLFRVKTLNSKPLQAYDITTYPQPFDPERDLTMTINGLAADSELRIITPSGEIVKVLEAQGKETVWDGRNKNGRFVDSGVYLIIAGSGKNGARSVGKFAVIKK
ncbi:two-component regulator propeller domain-containing protein [Candidatus Kapabacteria bacterium]|nr:two-component regulator propeller domain-containing protein [Candidatus Kapabacteria bacterium]